MSQMEKALSVFEAYESKDLAVRPDRCVRVRNRHAGCSACMDACPTHAITVELNELSVVWGECLGCEACVAVCPTEVFGSVAAGDEALKAAALAAAEAADGLVCFVCRPLYAKVAQLVDPAKTVVVNCMARVDATLLVDLAAAGVAGIALVHDACAACALAGAEEAARRAVEGARELVAAFGYAGRMALRDKLPSAIRRQEEAAFDEESRGFFASMKQEMRQVAGITARTVAEELPGEAVEEEEDPFAGKVLEDGTLPRVDGQRRKRLLGAVDALATDAPEPEATLQAGLFGRIAINREACRSCRMCANFCPTGALRKFDFADGRLGVKHMPALCVNCGCCRDICPTKALTVHARVAAKDVALRTSYAYYMAAPDVAYNRPDTMYRKVQPLFDTDQLYDMQH